MDLSEVRFLLAYNRWANAQVLDAADRLTPKEFTRDLRSSFPSVRDTLVHILSAEWLYLERWGGNSPAAMPDLGPLETVAGFRSCWREVEAGQRAFLEGLGPADLARVIGYTNFRGEAWRYPLGQMLQHTVNHSTYHRGQLATLLRQLGAAPNPTDLLVFVDVGAPGVEGIKG